MKKQEGRIMTRGGRGGGGKELEERHQSTRSQRVAFAPKLAEKKRTPLAEFMKGRNSAVHKGGRKKEEGGTISTHGRFNSGAVRAREGGKKGPPPIGWEGRREVEELRWMPLFVMHSKRAFPLSVEGKGSDFEPKTNTPATSS